MRPGNTQFGMRENTASLRQHDPRVAQPSILVLSVKSPAAEIDSRSLSEQLSYHSSVRSPSNAAHTAATGEEGTARVRRGLRSSSPTVNHETAVALKSHASARVDECPLTVREAAKFLGVSPQTVYLWVERKQIPHLRVMGRNIRFLKSDLETFRASFKQEMENA